MKNVVLKPELRTPGGETVSIYCDDDWAGDLYLVYREGDVLTGTIQLDTSKVDENDLDQVTDEIRTYIEHLNAALNVESSSVVMMYGDISSVVEMEPFEAAADPEDVDLELLADDDELIMAADDDEYDDENVLAVDDDVYDEVYSEVFDDEGYDEDEAYHLSVIYQEGTHTKYHLHDEDHQTFGVVAVDEIGNNVSGRVEFWEEPDQEETNEVARMLARTFSDGETESLSFTLNCGPEHLGDMHLEKHDLF
jgi:hypothetical protein